MEPNLPLKNEKIIASKAQVFHQCEWKTSRLLPGDIPAFSTDPSTPSGRFYIYPLQYFKVGTFPAPLDAAG